MNVENPADKTQRKLETKFAKEKNAYGTFAFQGDTLTWHTDDIKRPNEAAWLVCAKQQVFVNTGAYGYMTPEGCSDQTVSSFFASSFCLAFTGHHLRNANHLLTDPRLWRIDT